MVVVRGFMVVEDGAWWLLGGLWWRFEELLVVV